MKKENEMESEKSTTENGIVGKHYFSFRYKTDADIVQCDAVYMM